MDIEKLKKEYETQDNRGTAFPIYVTVQEFQFVCVVNDSYGFGEDYKIKYEYNYENSDNSNFSSKEDALEHMKRYMEGGDTEDIISFIGEIKEYPYLYIYVDVEFFLTIKGADEYIQANRHNLREPRTCVRHFERRNFEMRGLLKELGFRV